MGADLDRLLAPDYPGDPGGLSIEQVRAMRAECQQVETGLSLLRRIVQGRLDIVGLELRRRAGGGDPADLGSLIEQLPDVLAENSRAAGSGRMPQVFASTDVDADLQAELDRIVGEASLANLPSVSDEELDAMADALAALERRVSSQRRQLFERIDALQAELTGRYRSGEASVDELLR